MDLIMRSLGKESFPEAHPHQSQRATRKNYYSSMDDYDLKENTILQVDDLSQVYNCMEARASDISVRLL